MKHVTLMGLAVSAVLGLAGVVLKPAPAEAVVYCQYVDYPPSCVARAGVVLRRHIYRFRGRGKALHT